MALFHAYGINQETGRGYRLKAQLTGLIPIGFAVALMLSVPSRPGPGLWCALGVATGLELILWGMWHMHTAGDRLSRLGRRMVEQSEQWFPISLFLIRHTFELLLIFMLWFSVVELGYPASPVLHGIVCCLLVLLPCKGITREAIRTADSPRREILDALCHYLIVITLTLFLAVSFTRFILPVDEPLVGNIPQPVVLVWVPALIIIAGSFMFFAERIRPYVKAMEKPIAEKPDEF